MSPVTAWKEHKVLGWRPALVHFWRRRHIPLIGYILLSSAVGYQFAAERVHSNENRQTLKTSVQTVLLHACNRNNDLRSAVRFVLRESLPQIEEGVRTHQITAADGRRLTIRLHHDIDRFGPLDCPRAYELR